MAMSHVYRRASPTVVPHAIRAISSSRNVLHGKNDGFFHSQQFSTVADVDQNLVKALKSRIKWWKSQIPIAPTFPFKIEGNHKSTIKLKGELGEDKIEVSIKDLCILEGKNNNNNDKNDTVNDNSDSDSDDNSSLSDDDDEIDGDDDNKSSSDEEGQNGNIEHPSVYGLRLQVNISKKDGTLMKLVVLGSVHEIIIESIEMYNKKNHLAHVPPRLQELGIDVLNSIVEYIGARGVNIDFLLKYMDRGSDQSNIDQVLYQRQLCFLENFKNFVSK